MEFLCQKAGSSDLDLRQFDVIYLAALVGMNQEEKEDVLIDLVRRMSMGALVVIRTAHGLRNLLYPVWFLLNHRHDTNSLLTDEKGVRLYLRSSSGVSGDMLGCSPIQSCCQLGDCGKGKIESEEWPYVMRV